MSFLSHIYNTLQCGHIYTIKGGNAMWKHFPQSAMDRYGCELCNVLDRFHVFLNWQCSRCEWVRATFLTTGWILRKPKGAILRCKTKTRNLILIFWKGIKLRFWIFLPNFCTFVYLNLYFYFLDLLSSCKKISNDAARVVQESRTSLGLS